LYARPATIKATGDSVTAMPSTGNPIRPLSYLNTLSSREPLWVRATLVNDGTLDLNGHKIIP
jgi:hypothetical protein